MTEREKIIALIDTDCLRKSDAIVLLEGDGLNRYQKAVSLYKSGWADKIIFSGGITDYEYGSFPLSDILPEIIKEGIPESDLIHENNSRNTREQAIEIVSFVKKNPWAKKLILVATHEHQYRAYLTFLRVIIDSKLDIIIYNCPVRNLSWFAETGWGRRIDRLEQEFNRIEEYEKLGHIATFNEVINYQKWKEDLV